MAISDLVHADPTESKRGPDCTVCQALEWLPPSEAEALTALLRNKRWRYTEIAAKISDDPDSPDWVRNINHRTYARHATAGCAAKVRLR